jgi:hypothetical protein
MFYELGRQFGLQNVNFVSITGSGYTGVIKQNVCLKAVSLPTRNAIRVFPNSNKAFNYGNDVVILSSYLYLSTVELKRKQLVPKLEDYVIITIPQYGRKKHFIATIEGTVEDVLVLGLKSPIPLDNNDYIVGEIKTYLSFNSFFPNR